jgi:hypothetical protein
MYKQYKDPDGSTNQHAIIRTTDNACIPFSPDNTDYQEYLKWVAEGNEPLPPDSQE